MGLSEETVKANAMLAGLGRTRRVLMGDTLLDGSRPTKSRSSSPTRSATTSSGTSRR